MISITFQLDETQDIQSQIHRALVALGFGTANYTAPIHIVTAPAVATFTVETEEVVPAKRPRKNAKAPVTETVIPEVDDRDAKDEAVETSNGVLTHDDVRHVVGQYTKKFGIVAAQKNIPLILGCAIAELPDNQNTLQEAIEKIERYTHPRISYPALDADENLDSSLFDDVGEPEQEITEKDVRDALMVYAKKYDADDKMANTLIDGPDILKKTFGPTVTALRLIPKDPASLKKAFDAITDATENNWYNRKVQA